MGSYNPSEIMYAPDCADNPLEAETKYWLVFSEEVSGKSYALTTAATNAENVPEGEGWSMGDNIVTQATDRGHSNWITETDGSVVMVVFASKQ